MKTQSCTALILAVVVAFSSNVQADEFGTAPDDFTIEFVTIAGDAGDLGSWTAGSVYTFRGVDRDDYRMAMYEITNDQLDKCIAAYPGPRRP